MKLAACSACNAPMLWAITEASGLNAPLDASPILAVGDRRGLFVLVKTIDGPPLAVAASKLPELQLRDVAFYTSHFATCPDATRFRRQPMAAQR